MQVKINIYPDSDKLTESLALKILDSLKKTSDRQQEFNIAISGGSTPGKLFRFLAVHPHGLGVWRYVNFYWVDERCVPPDHEESNYHMAYEALLGSLELQEDQIHRIRSEDDSIREAGRYAALINKQVPQREGLPLFDLILLGMGEDGHTASIFPDRMDLIDTDQICETARHPESGQQRITLTGRTINNASQILFLISGREKSEKVAAILNEEEGRFQYPAAHIKPGHGSLEWFLDQEAACLL